MRAQTTTPTPKVAPANIARASRVLLLVVSRCIVVVCGSLLGVAALFHGGRQLAAVGDGNLCASASATKEKEGAAMLLSAGIVGQ